MGEGKLLQVHIQACETQLDTQTLNHGSVVHADISASKTLCIKDKFGQAKSLLEKSFIVRSEKNILTQWQEELEE